MNKNKRKPSVNSKRKKTSTGKKIENGKSEPLLTKENTVQKKTDKKNGKPLKEERLNSQPASTAAALSGAGASASSWKKKTSGIRKTLAGIFLDGPWPKAPEPDTESGISAAQYKTQQKALTRARALWIFRLVLRIAFACAVIGFVIAFFRHPDYYKSDKDGNETTMFQNSRTWFMLISAFVLFIISVLPNKLSDWVNKILGWICFAAAPAAIYAILFHLNSTRFHIVFANLNRIALVLTFAALYLALLFLLLLSGSVRFAVTALAAAVAVAGIVNWYVVSFRGQAISAADIFSVDAAVTVVNNYSFRVGWFVFSEAYLTFALVLLVMKVRRQKLWHWKTRLAVFAAWMIGAGGYFHLCCHTTFLEDHDIRSGGFTHQLRYKQFDMLFTTLTTCFYLVVDQPDGYSVKAVKEIAEPYVGSEGQTETLTASDKEWEEESTRQTEPWTETDTAAETRTADGTDAAADGTTGAIGNPGADGASGTDGDPAADSTSENEGKTNADASAGGETGTASDGPSGRTGGSSHSVDSSEAAAAMINTAGLSAIEKTRLLSASLSEAAARIGEETAAERSKMPQKDGFNTPNLIVIMNESLADYTNIGNGLSLTEDCMPFIHGLTENTIKGTLYASIFGANTPNSEYEFLTGLTMGFLPPTSVGFNLFVRGQMPSLASELKEVGYDTVAIHPYRGYNYRRNVVYPQIGFDTYLTRDDFKDPEYVRKYISDSCLVDKIEEVYEQHMATSPDTPLLCYNVTIQNHGDYLSSNVANLDLDIAVLDRTVNRTKSTIYINLVKESDKVFERLLNYFSGRDEPVVIVMFGDHQANLGESTYEHLLGKPEDELTPEELMEKYKIPFVVWANYDIEEEVIEKTSLNYLYSIMADRLNLPQTPFQSYLLDFQKQIPALAAGGYWGADGNFYELGDKTSPYYDLVNDYNILEYNYIFGKKKRDLELFTLKSEQETEQEAAAG